MSKITKRRQIRALRRQVKSLRQQFSRRITPMASSWIKITRELAEGNQALAEYINARMVYADSPAPHSPVRSIDWIRANVMNKSP